MNKGTNPLSWIKLDDQAQVAWVQKYLARQLPPCYLTTDNIDAIVISTYDHKMLYDADNTLLINKMRSAWRQKVFRSKQNGKKTYSFVMSRGIEAKLKVLSGKGKIRETLEELIENSHICAVPKINELNTKNQDLAFKTSLLREENNKIRLVNNSLNQSINIQDNEIDTLKKEIKLLQQDKVNLVNELKQLKEKHNNQFRLQDKE